MPVARRALFLCNGAESCLPVTAQCMAQMARVCSAREISLLAVEVLERATTLGNTIAVCSR
jgi:hypothetical protein